MKTPETSADDRQGRDRFSPVPEDAWSAFRAAVFLAAEKALNAADSSSAREKAARAVHDRAETFLAGHRRPSSLVACGPGCGHCCVVNVAVLEPEAHAIAHHLRTTWSPEAVDDLRQRLAELVRASRWLDDEERLMLRRPCAFLDAAGSCSIHPVRPLLCRKVTSINPEDCRDSVARHAFGETVPVIADLFHQQVFEEAFLAFGRALDHLGRNARSIRLSEGVLKLLNGSESRLHSVPSDPGKAPDSSGWEVSSESHQGSS
jgi:Fe-S-cluster containining protein